jgi:hypothetical protein
MSKRVIRGTAVDQETVFRLRPWIEDEARKEMGEKFQYTHLQIDYDAIDNKFNFILSFGTQPFDKQDTK